MFNNSVSQLNVIPKTLTNKVYSGENVDMTLCYTSIMLLYNRVKDLKIASIISKQPLSASYVDTVDSNPSIYSFHWVDGVTGNPDEILKPVAEKFQRIEKLPTHEKFISEQLKQPVYIRTMPEENCVYFFTTEISLPVWHSLQVYIPKYFQIFKEIPYTKEEASFLETLTFKQSKHYIEKLTELANKESFRNYVLKGQLEAFEKKLFTKKVESAKANLSSLEREMEMALDKYRRFCEKRIEALALVNGLRTMEDQMKEHTELQDYLVNNQSICNLSINDTNISFIVKTIFTPHHVDEWDEMSKDGKMFTRYTNSVFTDPSDIKLLLDAILSSKRCLRMKICAFFNMDYFGSCVNSQTRYNYVAENSALKDYIPNPHLQYHNCFGQNKAAILEQLTNGDAIGAIECCIACAQRIYIHDLSFVDFVNELLRSGGKCLIDENGNEMNVKEALAYLKGRTNE